MTQTVCGHKPPSPDCDFCSAAETEPDTVPQNPRFETHEFDAPAHWASALVNGDLTGLDYHGPACVAEFEAWLALNNRLNVVDCSAEPHIGRWNGLQTELLTYTALVYPSELSCDGTCEPMCAWCRQQADTAAQNRVE